MNARVPASADVLTAIVQGAIRNMEPAMYEASVREVSALYRGRLLQLMAQGDIGPASCDAGCASIKHAADDRIRTLRAMAQEAARRAA